MIWRVKIAGFIFDDAHGGGWKSVDILATHTQEIATPRAERAARNDDGGGSVSRNDDVSGDAACNDDGWECGLQ